MSIDIKDMVSRLNSESYSGEKKHGFPQGQGTYRFSNGIVYSGQMNEGMFDGEGSMSFPESGGKNKGGKFVARWDKGKLVNGTYYFNDELRYSTEDWSYCTDADRRFWTDMQNGIRLEDAPQLTDKTPSMWIPAGTYDLGDGYFDPLDNQVYSYAGKAIRVPSQEEMNWAIEKCRIGVGEDEEAAMADDEEAEYVYDDNDSELDAIIEGEEDDDFDGTMSLASTRPGTAATTGAGAQSRPQTTASMAVGTLVDDAISEAVQAAGTGARPATGLGTRPGSATSVCAQELVDGVLATVLGELGTTRPGTAVEGVSLTRPGTTTTVVAARLVDSVIDEALGDGGAGGLGSGLNTGRASLATPGTSRPSTAVVQLVDSVLEEIITGL